MQAHVLDVMYGVTDRIEGLPWYFPLIRRYAVGFTCSDMDLRHDGQRSADALGACRQRV